jgi:transcriptional regulator of arginine metabolism
MKSRRHAVILRAIAEARIENQQQLAAALARHGVKATQATLSRDIRELGLVKLSDPGGGAFYARPEDAAPRPALAKIFTTLLLSVDGVGPFVVLRTAAGAAGAVTAALDQAGWEEVIGTIAGDDTILVITRSERLRMVVAERIGALVR